MFDYVIFGFILLLLLAIIIVVPEWQIRKIDNPKDRVEHSNKARTAIAQIIGGFILLFTFFLSLEQLSSTNKIAREDRDHSLRLADSSNKVLMKQIEASITSADKDRSLARDDLNERIRNMDSLLVENRKNRELSNRQIIIQQENAYRQSNLLLFVEAIKLVSSNEPTTRIGGMNTLSNLGITDSTYTELALNTLINLMKVADQKAIERSINLESVSKILYNKHLKDFAYLGVDGQRIGVDGQAIMIRTGETPLIIDGIDFSNILVRDITLNGVTIRNCDLSNAYIQGDLTSSIIKNCKMDSAKIASSGDFKLDEIYFFGFGAKAKMGSSGENLTLFRTQVEADEYSNRFKDVKVTETTRIKVVLSKNRVKEINDSNDGSIWPISQMYGDTPNDFIELYDEETIGKLSKLGYTFIY